MAPSFKPHPSPSATLVAALLLLGASAAPQGHLSMEGATSGETRVEVTPQRRDPAAGWKTWDRVIGATERHHKEFEQEFHGSMQYFLLDSYKLSSFPFNCPANNFSKEACLHRLAHGLLVYRVLLRHVEKEYPENSISQEARMGIPLLVTQIKAKMKRSEQVRSLNSTEEQQLLQQLDSPDLLQRRLTAHSILRQLRFFLVDGKRALRKWDMPKRRKVGTRTRTSARTNKRTTTRMTTRASRRISASTRAGTGHPQL